MARKVAQTGFNPITDKSTRRGADARPRAVDTRFGGGWIDYEGALLADADPDQEMIDGAPAPDPNIVELNHGEELEIIVQSRKGEVIAKLDAKVTVGFVEKVVKKQTIDVRVQKIKIV